MKKSKVLTTPTRLNDIRFDDFYDDDMTSLKEERLNIQRWRRFKQEESI